jgi:HSP20 family protein
MFELTRRDPFDLTSLRDVMSTIANDPFFRMPAMRIAEEGSLPLDVCEEDGDIVVRASLPGFRKEDVDIQIHNGVLSINARHTGETETKNGTFYRRERRFGSVSRRLALPGVVADAKASAELKDGVLTLRIPLAEVAKPKQIAIR